MNTSPANGASTNAASNGSGPESVEYGDNVEVDVNVQEAVGVSILGLLLLLVLLALLRAHRRERKLLERLAELDT